MNLSYLDFFKEYRLFFQIIFKEEYWLFLHVSNKKSRFSFKIHNSINFEIHNFSFFLIKMDEMNENEFRALYNVLRKHYSKLTRVERIFYITSIVYVSGYVILFILFLVATGRFEYNFVTIPLIFFPIISLIITVSN